MRRDIACGFRATRISPQLWWIARCRARTLTSPAWEKARITGWYSPTMQLGRIPWRARKTVSASFPRTRTRWRSTGSRSPSSSPVMSSNGFHSSASRFHNLRSLFSVFSSDLAIDLGTANTLVYARGKGIVVNEPSIVAINKNTAEVEAVGKEAKEMLGRTPGNIVAIKPRKDGVIADFKVTEKRLNYFIQKAHNRKMLVHPRIVIGVPSEIKQVE